VVGSDAGGGEAPKWQHCGHWKFHGATERLPLAPVTDLQQD